MKKSLLTILALALVAVGCQNYDDQFDSLNSDIAALTTKVNGLDTSGIAGITSAIGTINQSLTDLQNAQLSEADITTALASTIAQVTQLVADMAALDQSVASQIAGVETSVASLTSQLSDVQTNALTTADIAALDEVANLNQEIADIQQDLTDLLAANASVNANVVITNQAQLDYSKTLFTGDGPYIVNGNVNIVASAATGYSAGYTAEISAITAKIASVIGTVTITTAAADATALDISNMAYIDGALSISGKMPSGFAVTTCASLALAVEEADISLPTLSSAAGGVAITAGTTTITNVAITNLTNGAVTTAANTLSLANADVNLGSGDPAATTTVKSLNAGGATSTYEGSITASGAVTLGSKVVTNTVIDAGGAVTLSNSAAGSGLYSSTINSGGDITASGLGLGYTQGAGVSLVCDGASGAVSVPNATATAKAFTATASGSSVSLPSLHTIAGGIATLTGATVDVSAVATNTTGLTVSTATALNLPALVNGTGKVTATAVTDFDAPLYTSNGTIDLGAGADVVLKAMTAIGNLSDLATISGLTLSEQDASLDLSTAVKLVTLNYTAKAIAAGGNAAEATDLTVAHLTSASSLTTVNITGGMDNVVLKAPLMTSITTGGFIRTFTTTGTALTSVVIGHQGLNGGAPSELSVTGTLIQSLDLSGLKWIGGITVTGNASLTAITMPTATAAADNANVATTGRVTVTINNNALTGAWTRSVTATGSNVYVEGFWSTAPGITGAKTWITALLGNVVIATSSVTYAIEVDAADADLAANSDSTAVDGTAAIDTAAELALLPN
tara:strand:- start:13360 stop:15753 length:2394 start_codon:yes stop_codon:yes gene_type:complete